MRNGSSLEAWLFVVLMIASIVGVFFVGSLAMKIYRIFKPFEKRDPDAFSISIANDIQVDGFFKTYFVGLVLCTPVLYYLFDSL